MTYAKKILSSCIFIFICSGLTLAQFIPPDSNNNKREDSLINFATKNKKEKKKIVPKREISEIQKKDLAKLDIVKNITAVVYDKYNYDVKIKWTPASLRDDYIIARSSVPINSLTRLKKADAIALKTSGVNFHIDKGLSPGTYYYAIAARSRIASEAFLLWPQQNYTIIPLVVSQTEIKKDISKISENLKKIPTQNKKAINLIYAQLINPQLKHIRISWRPTRSNLTGYIVYRSNQMINNLEKLKQATKVAQINNGAEFYVDKSIGNPGIYYYAIIAKDQNSNDINTLEAGQSFTQKGIILNANEIPITSYISTSKKSDNSIQLSWNQPLASKRLNLHFEIYRSHNPIYNDSQLFEATKVTNLTNDYQTFIDENLANGRYYYTIISKDNRGNQSSQFIAKKNITTIPVEISASFKNPQDNKKKILNNNIIPKNKIGNENNSGKLKIFNNFSIRQNNREVKLSWSSNHFHQSFSKDFSKIQIYRFTQRPFTLNDISHGDLIAKVTNSETSYLDIPPVRGVFFYAIFIESNTGLLPNTFNYNQNVVGPINYLPKVNKPNYVKHGNQQEVNLQYQGVNKLIANTYLKNKYNQAIIKLKPLLSKKFDKSTKAKIMFYLGLSYYRLDQFEKALELFVNPLVTTGYKKRAIFWYKRTLEQLK